MLKALLLILALMLGACATVPPPRYNNVEVLAGLAQIQNVYFFCEDLRSAQLYAQSEIIGEAFRYAGTTCAYNSDVTVPVQLDHSVHEYDDAWGQHVTVWVGNLIHEGNLLEPPVYVFMVPEPTREA